MIKSHVKVEEVSKKIWEWHITRKKKKQNRMLLLGDWCQGYEGKGRDFDDLTFLSG